MGHYLIHPWVGSGVVRPFTGRVGSGQVALESPCDRVGSGRVTRFSKLAGGVRSCEDFF